MLVGAGEMAELAAQHLHNHGVEAIIVASRTLANARKLAERFHGESIPLDAVAAHLPRVDILICSTAAPDYILHAEHVREVLRTRKYNPIFIIDIAVPRNIDPRVDDLENIYLYDMDDLQKVLKTNLEKRRKALHKAEVIVDQEVRRFLEWLGTLDVVPTIVSLRERAENIRKQELERALALLRPAASPAQRATLESMSQAIVNKLLHDPITQMKIAEREGDAAGTVDVVRRLFSLADDKE